jgi:hypothetical protein
VSVATTEIASNVAGRGGCDRTGCQLLATRTVYLHDQRAPQAVDLCLSHAAELERLDVCGVEGCRERAHANKRCKTHQDARLATVSTPPAVSDDLVELVVAAVEGGPGRPVGVIARELGRQRLDVRDALQAALERGLLRAAGDFTTRTWWPMPAEEDAVSRQDQILEILEAAPPHGLTSLEVASKLGIHYTKMGGALHQLLGKGRVERIAPDGPGLMRWRLPVDVDVDTDTDTDTDTDSGSGPEIPPADAPTAPANLAPEAPPAVGPSTVSGAKVCTDPHGPAGAEVCPECMAGAVGPRPVVAPPASPYVGAVTKAQARITELEAQVRKLELERDAAPTQYLGLQARLRDALGGYEDHQVDRVKQHVDELRAIDILLGDEVVPFRGDRLAELKRRDTELARAIDARARQADEVRVAVATAAEMWAPDGEMTLAEWVGGTLERLVVELGRTVQDLDAAKAELRQRPGAGLSVDQVVEIAHVVAKGGEWDDVRKVLSILGAELRAEDLVPHLVQLPPLLLLEALVENRPYPE